MAISYLPSKTTDAEDVIALIEAEGRTAAALAGDVTDEAVSDIPAPQTQKAAATLFSVAAAPMPSEKTGEP